MYISYQLGVYLYYLLILIASPFNKKAKLWIEGRKAQKKKLEIPLEDQPRIWFHFASLGEFEQGRALLEQIQSTYPAYKIVITFFSPSGYEIRKNYALAEKVYYLPLDTKKNARLLLNHLKPTLIFFNKYEYWYHYISEANQRNIPLFVSSAIFRNDQLFFKSIGSFQRKILSLVNYFFVQNENSIQLLNSINIKNAIICGDTRFDRVYEHSLQAKNIELIDKFCGNAKVLVAGSTWAPDEKLLANLLRDFPEMKLIIVPHEIGEAHITEIKQVYKNNSVLYSELSLNSELKNKNILIVNTIGILNSLYKYASYCYIGGGFGVGIHNTLEAAAFGKVLFFGPNYKKFNEAVELINTSAAFSVEHYLELKEKIDYFEQNQIAYNNSCTNAKNYVYSNKGASEKIINFLVANKYLT